MEDDILRSSRGPPWLWIYIEKVSLILSRALTRCIVYRPQILQNLSQVELTGDTQRKKGHSDGKSDMHVQS
jgi:hypothetical protein